MFRQFGILLSLVVILTSQNAFSIGFNEGPKKCQECHEQEYDVWKASPHFESYKKAHKTVEAKKIVKAVGEKSMKKGKACVLCHYTAIQKDASAKAKVKAGPSCESCHGSSSQWREIHNDFGGADVKAADETPAHKKQRLVDSEVKGMIASRMTYRLASNCMNCHGLGNKNLDAKTLSTMLEAGHPIKPEFEIVKYSQGQVRHRFVPPNVNDNSRLDAAGIARLYVGGQAAALVTASRIKNKVADTKFKSAQQARIKQAKAVMNAIKNTVPAAAFLLSKPTDANGLALEKAIENKDLSAQVAKFLPQEKDYK